MKMKHPLYKKKQTQKNKPNPAIYALFIMQLWAQICLI